MPEVTLPPGRMPFQQQIPEAAPLHGNLLRVVSLSSHTAERALQVEGLVELSHDAIL